MGNVPKLTKETMASPIPHVRRHYGADQLKLVIAQVRFPLLHGFGSEHLASLQAELRDAYPRASREHGLAITIGPGGAVPSQGGDQWRFTEVNGRWSVVVSPEFAGLETNDYTTFEDLCERFEALLQAVAPWEIRLRERVGLRYVNELRHRDAKKPSDWHKHKLLNPTMLGPVGVIFDDGVFHALQEVRLSIPPMASIIRHGYVGSEPTQGDPYYLVDLDAFDESPTDFDVQSSMTQLKDFHDFLENKWEMTLEDAMRQSLGDEGPVE
jgi:uncharacterized protein (TIGR04255 family)